MNGIARTSLLGLCLACATGVGEEATGEVELSVLPAGSASAGVVFDRAQLTLGHMELHPAEEAEAPADDGHGHGHSHLVQGLAAGAVEGSTIDLLGGEQPLGITAAAVGAYEAVHVELAAAAEGEASGCVLFATGTATVEETTRPFRLCLPRGADVFEVPLEAEVELDETTPVRLFVAVNGLLRGVPLADLEPGADGSLAVDASQNSGALETIRENLGAALSVPAR